MARIRFGSRAADDVFHPTFPGFAAFGCVLAAGEVSASLVRAPDLDHWPLLAVMVPACLAWYLTAALAIPLWSGQRHRAPAGSLLRSALAEGPAYLVLFSAGALFGVAAPTMGWWAVALAGIPYAFAHLSFQRLEATRATYRQTIRALGRIPEAGGYAQPGHAERTAALAAAIGREVGLSRAQVREVEYSGHLCDIGRIALADPAIAGGGFSTADLAQWSAAIVGEAPYLAPVAALVADSHKPYRKSGEERDPDLSPGSQVVKIASAYDYHRAGGMEPVDALEMLHRGAAYEYDPELVAVLRRVLQRQGVAGV